MDNLKKYNKAFMDTFEITEDRLPGLKYQDVKAGPLRIDSRSKAGNAAANYYYFLFHQSSITSPSYAGSMFPYCLSSLTNSPWVGKEWLRCVSHVCSAPILCASSTAS